MFQDNSNPWASQPIGCEQMSCSVYKFFETCHCCALYYRSLPALSFLLAVLIMILPYCPGHRETVADSIKATLQTRQSGNCPS